MMKRCLLALIAALILCVPAYAQGGMGPGPGVKSYSGGGGGGPTLASDTFTETSDTALASHTAETGGTWQLHPSYSAAATVSGSLDRMFPTATTAYFLNVTPTNADYCVSADYYNVTSVSANIGIALRMSATTDDMYFFRLNSGTSWEWIARISGANGTIGPSSTNSLPTAGGSPVNVKICAAGSALTVFFNGVQDTSLNRTDSSITAAGKPGFRASTGVTATTGFHLDNFIATQ